MRCSYCKKEIEPGTGKIYALRDGTRYYFCCGKCEKNFELGRKPRKVKWIKKKKKGSK